MKDPSTTSKLREDETNTMFLNRDDIVGAKDYRTVDVKVNEWRPEGVTEDAYVKVRPMTAGQRARYESAMVELHQTNKNFDKIGEYGLKVVAWCVVDEEGKRIFNDADVKQLEQKSSAPILRIRDAALKLSGMGSEAVDEAAEDFGETPENASSTA